jgi:hypothetical protein
MVWQQHLFVPQGKPTCRNPQTQSTTRYDAGKMQRPTGWVPVNLKFSGVPHFRNLSVFGVTQNEQLMEFQPRHAIRFIPPALPHWQGSLKINTPNQRWAYLMR